MSKVDFRNYDIEDIDDSVERFERIHSSKDNVNSKYDRDRERSKNSRRGSRNDRQKRNSEYVYDRLDRDR